MKREDLWWETDNECWNFSIDARSWALPFYVSFFDGIGFYFLCFAVWYTPRKRKKAS